ncbi:unnamed protein product, partial [Rotaria sordida]
MNRGIIE